MEKKKLKEIDLNIYLVSKDESNSLRLFKASALLWFIIALVEFLWLILR